MLQLKKHNFTAVILLIIFLSVGCTTKTVYHSYQSVKELDGTGKIHSFLVFPKT